MCGINVGKLEDIMNECSEWGLDIVCLTETQMREMIEINEKGQEYRVINKGRSKQTCKGGGVAVMMKNNTDISCEVMNVGNCNMSEDILVVKLEYKASMCDKKASLYVCLCYMTVEGAEGAVENKKKYDIVQGFVDEHKEEKVLVMGDMNGHIGLLGEEQNVNGKLLREACEKMNLEILNETIAEGRITWQRKGMKSAIDYMLANENARECIVNMWVDESGELDIVSDPNMLTVYYLGERKEKMRENGV